MNELILLEHCDEKNPDLPNLKCTCPFVTPSLLRPAFPLPLYFSLEDTEDLYIDV